MSLYRFINPQSCALNYTLAMSPSWRQCTRRFRVRAIDKTRFANPSSLIPQPIPYQVSSTLRRQMSTSSPVKRLAPLSFPTSGFKILDTSEKFEEETLPGYEAWMFYPAHIGEVLNDRYQLVGKLGFGTTSTVWLARDLVCVCLSL